MNIIEFRATNQIDHTVRIPREIDIQSFKLNKVRREDIVTGVTTAQELDLFVRRVTRQLTGGLFDWIGFPPEQPRFDKRTKLYLSDLLEEQISDLDLLKIHGIPVCFNNILLNHKIKVVEFTAHAGLLDKEDNLVGKAVRSARLSFNSSRNRFTASSISKGNHFESALVG